MPLYPFPIFNARLLAYISFLFLSLQQILNIHLIVLSAVPGFVGLCVLGSRFMDNIENDCKRGTTYYDIHG